MHSMTGWTLIVLWGMVSGFGRGSEAEITSSQIARGRVFHDVNGNRSYDMGEKLLPGIRVSNGRDIVHTNAGGIFEVAVSDDTIIFVIKPRGWQVPLSSSQLPQFYYNHKPSGSPVQEYAGVAPTGPLPEFVDFPLYPQKEPDHFEAILFGDTQPRNQKEIDYLAHDVVEELVGSDAAFGVTLGDIVFDKLSLFESYARTVALIGVPWYNVIGNHDINLDAESDKQSDESFERVFGPSYYSFDYGPTHFIVLDNIEWVVEKEQDGQLRKSYRGGLGSRQVEFVKRDLSLIPENQFVVLMMHVPLTEVHDRHGLYRLIEKRPFCLSISGHTHYQEHRFISDEDGWKGPVDHHHIVSVTACGSWWRGTPDERGIPHTMMRDGAPNGYAILSFDGNRYSWRFKAAGKPKDYQMHIVAPDEVISGQTGTSVYVNVFGGSKRSRVAMRISPHMEWTWMQEVSEADPLYLHEFNREKTLSDKTWIALPDPIVSSHLWKVPLPGDLQPGTHLIEVRSTDMFGHIDHGNRVIRVLKPEKK